MICISNVINTDYGMIRVSGSSMERSIRMTLSSAPALDEHLQTGEIFKIGVLITAKNVRQSKAIISFEPELVQLVDSPKEVEFGSGSYDVEAEWLLRALKPTTSTAIRIQCKADDIPQVIEFTMRILPSDRLYESGEINEGI